MPALRLVRFVVVACLWGACGSQANVDKDAAPDDIRADAGLQTDAMASDPMLQQLRSAQRILWIGAHPDDETTVSPLLADACLNHGATCALLVLTRGENGKCPGCTSTTGDVRAGELLQSAALLGANVIPQGYEDHVGGDADETLAVWAAQAGSRALLVDDIAAEIAQFAPTLILAFDPRHGVTCHQGHRAAGAVAVLASEQAGIDPASVWLVESTITVTGSEPAFNSAGYTPMVPGDEALWNYNARQALPVTSRTGWSYLVDVLSAHKTQFSTADVAAFDSAPAQQRAVFVARLSDVDFDDARYGEVCFR